ncbi:MAG: TetR/AcrR family transcriptional regulator [bacterium]|nr:TetR/AcrR family transcriptional regulator [bacterium]
MTDGSESPRKTRRGKVTLEKILDVTEALIAELGPDRFQLQQVTEALGITPPAIYNHVRDRDDLIAQVAARGGQRMAERIRREPGETTLDALRRNAREYVGFLAEHPAHARMILWETARRGTSDWSELAPSNVEISARTRTTFEEAISRGEIKPIALSTYMQALYVGYAAAVVWRTFPFDRKDDRKDDRNDAGVAASSSSLDAEEIIRMQEEADELVLRLLAP